MTSRHHTSRSAYRRLLASYDGLDAHAGAEERWAWLMAAHVVGQAVLTLHLHSHWRMLELAVRGRDARELAGQVFRLALVPLGHALGRLPAGNVGRATVSAFRPMRPPMHVRRLVAWARAGGGAPAACGLSSGACPRCRPARTS